MKIDIMHPHNSEVYPVPIKTFTFSGGEEHVRVDADTMIALTEPGSRVIVHQEVRSGNDFMVLLMTKNAIDNILRFIPHTTELVMLYVPYARQDRVCEPGEANGIGAFAEALNNLNFDRVTVADPHSDVTPAVIHNLFVIPQEEIAMFAINWKLRMEEFDLVSPDGGALKKIFKLAKPMQLTVHCAEKIRDTKTGDIVKTNINVEDFGGKNLMIVDDICDGGRTFIELAKVLRERNAGKIELFVTHGIFSKGMKELNEHFDCIHSFNVWENNVDETGKLVLNQQALQNFILNGNLRKNYK